MKISIKTKPKKALAYIWDIDIKDPKDGINFLETICKLEDSHEVFLNHIFDGYYNHNVKRRNALNHIWNIKESQ
jgi:hypothetical protein